MNARELAKGIFPPLLTGALRGILGPAMKNRLRFTGDYSSWEEAQRSSTGYDAPVILEKTREALLLVKNGSAVFERDSMTSSVPQYPLPLLAGLLRVAAERENRLSILDFGGSLGSTYFRCRSFLTPLKELRWSVIEQPAHVACDRPEFANEQLRFYESIAECIRSESPDVILLSGVVQYLQGPYEFIADVIQHRFQFVILDRTAFLREGRDRLTVQHVPHSIYPASYPCWFLSEAKVTRAFEERYDMLASFTAFDETQPQGGKADYKGFIFRLKATV